MKATDPTLCGLTESRNTSIPVRLTDPGLTARLLSDQAALANDLDQAKELASDLRQLASDKANEVAHFKHLLERTQSDLARFEKHITELRAERHRLANEVMKATGYELETKKLKAECARLRAENQELRQKSSQGNESATDQRIEELARLVERLQETIENPGPAPVRATRSAAPTNSNVIDISFKR